MVMRGACLNVIEVRPLLIELKKYVGPVFNNKKAKSQNIHSEG